MINTVELLREVGFLGEVRENEPMSQHTSLRIGGPAEVMAFPSSVEELSRMMAAATANKVPVFALGRGTNILVLDGGVRGLVINLSKLSWTELERGAAGTIQAHAGAGVTLPKLVSYLADNGCSGLEFAAGIPGTVGGAVAMNAGTKEAEMKDVLTSVTLVESDGTVKRMKPAELEMGYRRCKLPEGSVLAEASFAVIPWPVEEVKERVAAAIRRRGNTQPTGVRSAGSTFKNPEGYSAWRLIEMAGLRSKSVGHAQVSSKHTNFLINTGGATAKDYKALMDLVVATVKEKLNITLETEIKIVGVDAPARSAT